MFKKSIYISLLLIGVKSQDYYTQQTHPQIYQPFPQDNIQNVQAPNVEDQELKYFAPNQAKNNIKQMTNFYPQYHSNPELVTNQYQNTYVPMYNTNNENQNHYVAMTSQPAPVYEENCNLGSQEIQNLYQRPNQQYKPNKPQPVEYYKQNQQQLIQYHRSPIQNQEYQKLDSRKNDNNQQYQNYENSWQPNTQVIETQRKTPSNNPPQYAETYENKKPEGLSAYKSNDYENDYPYQPNVQDDGVSNYDAVSPHLQPPPNQQHQYYKFQGVQS